MTNVVVLSGKIVSGGLNYKPAEDNRDSLLEIKINCVTGQKKKGDEQYAPSVLVKTTLWSKFADSMSEYLEEGMFITLDGKIAVPDTYIKDDEARAVIVLHNAGVSFDPSKVFKDDEEDTKQTKADKTKTATKTTTSKGTSSAKTKQAKAVTPVEEDNDELEEDLFAMDE